MKYDYQNLIYEKTLKKRELSALLIHINRNLEQKKARLLVSKFNNQLQINNGIYLLSEYYIDAYKYLLKNHFNKKGNIKKNTPFNSINIEILNDLETIKLIEIYNGGTPFKDFFTPLYQANAKNGKYFKYFNFNNEIQIYNL